MPQWVKGQSGNPAGRPKGSRDRLTESVYADLVNHWAEHGLEAIERLYKDRPDLYVSAVVRLIPVHHQVAVDHRRRSAIEFTTEELLGMVNGEVIEHEPEHEPTKRLIQTDIPSVVVVEDTGPVDGDA